VAAFVPLGLGLAVIGARLGMRPWAALLGAIVVAGVFSLTMESIQYLLPHRYSSLVDVASDTTGAALGAVAAGIAQRAWNAPGARRQT
jgi:VanZ family protein